LAPIFHSPGRALYGKVHHTGPCKRTGRSQQSDVMDRVVLALKEGTTVLIGDQIECVWVASIAPAEL